MRPASTSTAPSAITSRAGFMVSTVADRISSFPDMRRKATGFRAGMPLAARWRMIPISRTATAIALTAALASFGAAARNPLTSLHPEEFYPDAAPLLATPDEFGPFIMRVQEKLRQLGFDAGPVNGGFGAKTQAALAQFQLAHTLPASGQLDEATLQALGVSREAQQDNTSPPPRS
ncbi:MAG: peptidoglycan-binding domain-containing protein [Betaproteobacteria bacterium]